MLGRPVRHFYRLFQNDIERNHKTEDDRKEVDRQTRDVGCSAVLEAPQNVPKHRQGRSGAQYNKDREYGRRRSLADHLPASVWIRDLKRQHR